MRNVVFRLNPQSLVQNMITGKPNVDPARMGYKVSADPEIVGKLIKKLISLGLPLLIDVLCQLSWIQF